MGHTIITFDEVGFCLIPVCKKRWFIRGTKPIVPFCWNNRTLKLFGALINGKKVFYKYSNKLNSTMFRAFLYDLIKTLDFSQKYVFILDNASYHKSKKVKEFMQDYPNITLEYLPPYSPELNPIETCWKITKARITYNHYFQRIEDMQEAISCFLSEHNFMLNLSNYLCR